MIAFSIHHLYEKPEYADICAAWSFGQWGCYMPGATLKKSIESYRKRADNKDTLPHYAIALETKSNRIAGVMGLKEYDRDDLRDYGPWVGSFYVHPFYRGKKVIEPLYHYIEDYARQQGFETLYGFTGRQTGLYKKADWVEMGKVSDPMGFDETNTLMKKDLI